MSRVDSTKQKKMMRGRRLGQTQEAHEAHEE